MTKTISYTGLIISAILVVFVFLTAKTYTQLIIAVILYPLLAYFALKVIPKRSSAEAPTISVNLPTIPQRTVDKADYVKRERVEVADIDKRTFLKLIGTAGISFFIFSILGRRVDSFLFNGSGSGGTSSSGIIPGASMSQTGSITDGYKITEIDDGLVSYYGFTNQAGNWLIMKEDTQTSSFRYAKGAKDFAGNWKNRQDLRYDYYYNLF